MTKAEVNRIAQVINYEREVAEGNYETYGLKGIESVAQALAVEFKRGHPRFSKVQFLNACGFGYAAIEG